MEAVFLSDQDELEKIKQRKLKQLLERAEQLQSMKARQENDQQEQAARVKEARLQILTRVLDPEAHNYLRQLSTTKPETVEKIESIIISLVLQRRLTYVSKVQIRALERRIEGVEPSITVKRRGKKAESFSEAIRKEDE